MYPLKLAYSTQNTTHTHAQHSDCAEILKQGLHVVFCTLTPSNNQWSSCTNQTIFGICSLTLTGKGQTVETLWWLPSLNCVHLAMLKRDTGICGAQIWDGYFKINQAKWSISVLRLDIHPPAGPSTVATNPDVCSCVGHCSGPLHRELGILYVAHRTAKLHDPRPELSHGWGEGLITVLLISHGSFHFPLSRSFDPDVSIPQSLLRRITW